MKTLGICVNYLDVRQCISVLNDTTRNFKFLGLEKQDHKLTILKPYE